MALSLMAQRYRCLLTFRSAHHRTHMFQDGPAMQLERRCLGENDGLDVPATQRQIGLKEVLPKRAIAIHQTGLRRPRSVVRVALTRRPPS